MLILNYFIIIPCERLFPEGTKVMAEGDKFQAAVCTILRTLRKKLFPRKGPSYVLV